MRTLLLTISLLVHIPILASAGGLQMSAEASRFSSMTRTSTVAEYWGVVDGSNNLIDMSGENLLTDRTEFDDWGENGVCTVTADIWRNPVDGSVDADYLDNTGGIANNNRDMSTGALGALAGRTFTASVWVRVDTPHVVTIRLWENGVGELFSYDYNATTTWQRIYYSGICTGGGAGTLAMQVHPGQRGVATGTAYFYGAQLIENDEWRSGMGVYLNPSDQAVTKPDHDLAPNNAPTSAKAHLQGGGGNKLEARRSDGNRHYSKADHASINVFDGDHTVTILVSQDVGAGADSLINHSAWNTDGVGLYADPGNTRYIAYYHQNGAHQSIINNTDPDDGHYHIVQLVRSNNTATMYVDGVAGTGVDVTGYGIDGVRNLAVMANSTGTEDLDGDISYIRFDAEALSTDDLAADREVLFGIATNWSQVNAWTLDRSTTAYKQFSAGGAHAIVSHMNEVTVDHPRVAGKGGGLLVEGQSTNICLQSQTFDNATWIKERITAVTVDGLMALNGNMEAEGFISNAVNDTHSVRQANITLTASTYTFSVYARAGIEDWIQVAVPTLVTTSAYFNLANGTIGTVAANATAGIENLPDGWHRCWITYTGTAAAHTHRIYFAEADGDNVFAGDATNETAWLWGAQVENLSFPSSYIPTTTAAVTRTADDITMDPHPANMNEIVLPEEFCATCAASKLTMYGEFKCQWSSSADLGSDWRWLVSVDGNAGTASATRNRFETHVTNATGRITGRIRDDSDNDHEVRTGNDPVDFSEWFSVRFFVDFADFSRMDMWVRQLPDAESNAGMVYTGNAGSDSFDTTNTSIRLGQSNTGVTINSHCQYRNLRIVPAEVTP